MFKIMIPVLCCILFISCQEKGPERFSTTGAEVDLVKAVIEAYEKGDWEAWKSTYADTAKVYYNSWNSHIDVADALEGHQNTASLMASYEFEDDPIFFEKVITDDGNTWVNFWGHWVGSLAENGQGLQTPVHVSFQVADGKIVEEHGFWDNAPLNKAMQELAASKNMPETVQNIKTTHDRFTDFWNKHDTEILKDIIHANVVRYTNGNKEATNKEEYAAFAEVFFTAFPDLRFTVRDVTISDGKSSHYWTGMGTNTGPFGDNAATGKTITTYGHTVITYNKEGKIIKDESFFDMADMYQQLGYTISPPAE